LKLIRLAESIGGAQTVHYGSGAWHVRWTSNGCGSNCWFLSNKAAESQGAAALLQCCSVGIQTLYSCAAGECAFMTFASAAFCCPGRRLGNSLLPASNGPLEFVFTVQPGREKARGSGAVGFQFSWLKRGGWCSPFLSVKVLRRSILFLPGPCPCLSLTQLL
jgi:hypothetical protein